jgi:hypothetical protein
MSWLSSRLAGLVCLLGSAVLLVDALLILVDPPEAAAGVDRLVTASSVGQLAGSVGIAAGYLGLIILGACGPGRTSRRLAWLPLVGTLISHVGWWMPAPTGDLAVFGDIIHLVGAVAVAILVLQAGVWLGWRRFTPLGILAATPVSMAAVLVTGRIGSAVVIGAIAAMVLGFAVASTRPVAHWGDRPALRR